MEKPVDPPHRGTRIVLPWARDPNSPFRRKANATVVSRNVEEDLLGALDEAIAPAMLFLRNLKRIELARDGRVVRVVTREVDGDEVIVRDNEEERRWRLLSGNFQEEAERLRARHGRAIETARKATVGVAIPVGFDVEGRLCATLPTARPSGLPMHVNAEFYLASDRRQPEMGAREHRDWNAAAVDCAAKLIAEALGELPGLLGPERLWAALGVARELEQKKDPDIVTEILGAFWRRLKPEIPNRKLVWTGDERWVKVGRARLVRSSEDEVAMPVLQGIGIASVHPDLRAHQNVLLSVGVQALSLNDIADALLGIGLDGDVPMDELPSPLDNTVALGQMWSQLGRMIGRLRASDARSAAIEELGDAAVVPSRGGELCPVDALWRTDERAVELMSALSPGFPFLDRGLLPDEAAPLAELCDPLTASGAVVELGRGQPLRVDVGLARELIGWLAHREDGLDGEDREALSRLAIFPSTSGIHPLSDLALPGDFEDRLGLALLVERETSREHGGFLTRLGIRQLSFAVYAREHVPRVIREGNLSAERQRAVVSLLAERKGQLDDVPHARSALATVPLVECADGDWRLAKDVYLDRGSVAEVLGPRPPRAKLPAGHGRAVEELLAWLGVAHEPRPADVVHRVRELYRQEVRVALGSVERVVNWVGGRWETLDAGARNELLPLRTFPWLPARGSEAWHPPGDLHLVFRDYLYESQGRFLDLGRPVQNKAVDFLRWLGLSANPSIGQVVAHLCHCTRTDTQPNLEVYDFLNSHPEAPQVAKLRDVACLRIDDGTWYLPSEVYWSEHPFGRWGLRLGPELARYRALFDVLGVKERPGHDDAMRVIREISEEYLPFNRAVPDEDRAVILNCWGLCEAALSRGELGQAKLAAFGKGKVIPNSRGRLTEARRLFFEDLPGLAEQLPGVENDIIQRPDGAWRAMYAAGVRDLSKVAVAQIVDRGDRIPGEVLLRRVHEREVELARVITPRTPIPWRQVAEAMRELSLTEVTSLTVRWELVAFGGRRFPGEPRRADALWQEAERTLYVAVVDGAPVWEAVARELVRALLPEIEPATLALDIAATLSPPTTEGAKRALDAAGCPPLAPEIRVQLSTEVATGLDAVKTKEPELAGQGNEGGADVEDELGGEYGIGGDWPANGDTAWNEDGGEDAGGTLERSGVTTGFSDSSGDASGSGAGGGREQPSDEDDHETGREKGKGTAERGEGQEQSPSRPRGHLRSYVVPGGGGGDEDESPNADGARSAVDEAGVAAVVRFEQGAGRSPKVEPHNNPGYDVLSRDRDGEVARYVEVKSSEGPWDGAGVGLSSRQFERAQQEGDRFWLYVVEYALDDGRRTVWRVPDPARRVTDFMFDSGWKDAVEHDEADGALERRDIRFMGGKRL
ncbi:MAG: DUF3883 domain-containing protein [Actinomycetota bacterium]|nr:DUF3883 domain-containing protein [Actinomycetota bacterium]